MREVQAFIDNISFPKTMEEFLFFLEDNFHFNVDDILNESYVEWTAPRWCKINDIVFFMHSKTSISIITKLRTEYLTNKDRYSKKQQNLIEKGLEHALDNYKKYGGKIYAIGRVVEPTEYNDLYEENVKLHWRGKIYAGISDIMVLDNPISIESFNDFIYVSRQSAITGVWGKEYTKLKKIIKSQNRVKKYFEDSISTVLPIKDINKNNWLNIAGRCRRDFFQESQFRTYYTDYLLKELADNNVFRECRCKKSNEPDCFVDNVIFINNYPVLVEIKLNINNEKDLIKQIKKYCNSDSIIIGKKDYENNKYVTRKAILIDTEGIYIYNNKTNYIKQIYDFNNLKEKNDINRIKMIIIKEMNLE